MYKSFRDMDVWNNAINASTEVFNITKSLPKSEDYGLTSQIRRSSNSVSGNIAEAFGRKHPKDKSMFYVIARGSAFETQSHLLYGQKVGYFDEKVVNHTTEKYNQLIHELNKILKSLS